MCWALEAHYFLISVVGLYGYGPQLTPPLIRVLLELETGVFEICYEY